MEGVSGTILGLACPDSARGFGPLRIGTGSECIGTRWKRIAEKLELAASVSRNWLRAYQGMRVVLIFPLAFP